MSEVSPAFPEPRSMDNVRYRPSEAELRALAAADERTTEFDSPSYTSAFTSRSADRTANTVDDGLTADDTRHIRRAHDHLRSHEFVCVDRLVGRHTEHSYVCRFFVPTEYARIALSLSRLLEPAPEGASPDFQTLQLPDWEETRIRVLVDEGVTYVLGSDYTGEAKKSFLRLFMYATKRAGGLGLHAGSKRVTVESDGDLRTVGQLYLGLSATGKSTLTGHGFGLEPPERAEMLQDDVCALLSDGAVAGSEGNGLFIKTLGLDGDEQPELHHAATRPAAVFENVDVAADGAVDFDSDRHTANSRAIVRRADLPNAAADLDLDSVDQVFFITRNPLVPPVARLSHAQAAAAFVLGESIETSAGDPSRAGEAIRVVGTNPFIVGSKGAEGNRFLDLVSANDVDCHLINTGAVGDRDVGVEETVAILRAVTRGDVSWTADDELGVAVPESVAGVDVDAFHPPTVVDDYAEKLTALRAERRAHLATFDDLREEIRDAVY